MNIPKRLLKTPIKRYIKRQPASLRLARFNALSRYSWLKGSLEDLRPELFPQPGKVPSLPVSAEPSAEAQQLIHTQIRGRRGLYEVTHWLRKRGNGNLFRAVQLSSKQPVVIKEYLLPIQSFNSEELRQKQRAFSHFGGFQYLDDQTRDIRVIRPLEAIVDLGTEDELAGVRPAFRRCYLVTDSRDANPTLAQQIAVRGALPAAQVRAMLSQLLQTLSVLHQQKVLLPSEQIQLGLVHGNLRLDNVLWIEEKGYPFLYLSDFALWEQIFQSASTGRSNSAVTPTSVVEDLRSVGRIGVSLLTGAEQTTSASADTSPLASYSGDPELESFIRRLLEPEGVPFETAEVAWQALLTLPVPAQPAFGRGERVTAVETPARISWRSPTLLAGLGLVLTGSLIWLLRSRAQSRAERTAHPAVCCLADISGIPPGSFRYAVVEAGIWQSVLEQENLGVPGRSLAAALSDQMVLDGAAPPEITQAQAVRVSSLAEAIEQVETGAVDFAILPLGDPAAVPIGLGWQAIAYDGLAAVVPFSYANRDRGVPKSLQGSLSLSELKDIYTGTVLNWREVGGPRLPLTVHMDNSPEVVTTFEQRVLNPVTFSELAPTYLEQRPPIHLLRAIIREFESVPQAGGIGLVPLSEVVGQCAVYPLALSTVGQQAVQPWKLVSGDPIEPTTDLCNRKGLYHPDVSVFEGGAYPLAYPIAVVYPQDNSRSPIGQKFAELMQTEEGQTLLTEAGLVPLQETKQ